MRLQRDERVHEVRERNVLIGHAVDVVRGQGDVYTSG